MDSHEAYLIRPDHYITLRASAEGIIYHKYFNSMPVKVVTLVLTAVSYISYSYIQVDGADDV